MINDPTTSSDENIDAPSQLESLILNICSAIDSEHVVFPFILLKSVQFFGDLQG